MSYQVLARKYRPKKFCELIGQEHVARSLSHAIERNRVAHAYIFAGARGVGKTSVARIFSQALNCSVRSSTEPCGECENCRAVQKGNSLAVWEIDGASHNGVENVRELIESTRNALPSNYNYRVYIIDEVHMLSVAAFNALLKTLEEPLSATVFILATTELQKIPDTVLSRCQRFDFKLMSSDAIGKRLLHVLEQEKITCDSSTVSLLGRLAEGSLRDALSLLDRVISYCGNEINVDEASQILGVVNRGELLRLSASILERKVDEALIILKSLSSQGCDTSILLREFVAHWRELLLATYLSSEQLAALGVGDQDSALLKAQSALVDKFDLQELNDTAREESDRALRGFHPWYAFEALVVRMATRERYVDLESIFNGRKEPTRSSKDRTAQNSSHPAKKSSATTEKHPADVPSASLGPATIGTPLVWNDFLKFANQTLGNSFLGEILKKGKAEKFETGVLVISVAHAFDKKTMTTLENEAKLRALLEKFSAVKEWSIKVEEVNHGKDVSLTATMKPSVENNKEDIIFANLKEVFPGCKLEK
jgi:DNA polymerase III subunit gamma/tau